MPTHTTGLDGIAQLLVLPTLIVALLVSLRFALLLVKGVLIQLVTVDNVAPAANGIEARAGRVVLGSDGLAGRAG